MTQEEKSENLMFNRPLSVNARRNRWICKWTTQIMTQMWN